MISNPIAVFDLGRTRIVARPSLFVTGALLLSLLLVALDHLSGPRLYLPALFVVPVGLVAWERGHEALLWALVLPFSRVFHVLFFWHDVRVATLITNVCINAFTLVLVALLVTKLAQQARLLRQGWDRTLACLPVGVLATDAAGQVRYANDMARHINERLSLGGATESTALHSRTALERALQHGLSTRSEELELYGAGKQLHVLLSSTSPVTDEHGKVTGAVTVYEDISERKALERERERLNAWLSSALAEVKVLKGLLPMCASCGKVRNAGGDWERIERYLVENSDLQVSHGICTDCAHELYPDYVARLSESEG